ncbi:MAG: hypothetical protein PHP20_00110 [Firmicutes bacterium]|nr:hypothetical protein [Bacillota bacterium]MDD4337303.1 hypothetical protein [Bacillota bacterium]MDD4791461.1 hypothetical protein [Bacillota bacterium]
MRRVPVLLMIMLCVFMAGCAGGGCDKYTASGRITRADNPQQGVDGVTIAFSGGHGTAGTDASGNFSKGGLKGLVSVTPAKEHWVFEPVSRQVSGESSNVNFAGRRLLTDDELEAIETTSEQATQMLESGSTYQQVADWLREQNCVEEVCYESEISEIHVKYLSGGWEFWMPASPMPEDAVESQSFAEFPGVNLPRGLVNRRAAVINCWSSEPKMSYAKEDLLGAVTVLKLMGYRPEYIESGGDILECLKSLNDCAVVVMVGHGSGSADRPHSITTGLPWQDYYGEEWCQDLWRKGNVQYSDNEIRSYVSILPKFWTTYYSSKPFERTLFINGSCSPSKPRPEGLNHWDALSQVGVECHIGYDRLCHTGPLMAKAMLSKLQLGQSTGFAFGALPWNLRYLLLHNSHLKLDGNPNLCITGPLLSTININPAAYLLPQSQWSGWGPSHRWFWGLYSQAWGGGVGNLTYHFSLENAIHVAGATIMARLSAETLGFGGGPPDGYSDVTLYLNGTRYDTQRVIPDDGKGQRYVWVVDGTDIREDNTFSFAVEATADYKNGLVIYPTDDFPRGNDDPITIHVYGSFGGGGGW